MPTIVSTPGAANANSYVSLAEFDAYLADRLPVPTAVIALSQAQRESAIIQGTRALDQILTNGGRRLEVIKSSNGMTKFYITRPYWTGSPATTTQSLAWPRTGMLDRNGNAIASDVIPMDLKIATMEMAIIAASTDLYADNAIVVQGITELTAGPVSLSFKDYIQTRSLPSSVTLALVPSWLTEELYENALTGAQFQTLGTR